MNCKKLLLATMLYYSMAASAGTFIAAESESYDTKEIRKIAFVGDQTETTFKDGRVLYHDFTSLQRIYFVQDESTGTDLLKQGEEILLYPNPVVEKLYLSGLSEESNISLYSASGELKKNFTTKEKKVEISTEELSSGIYFLKINGTTIKFIKQ